MHVARMGDDNCIKRLAGNPEEKMPHGRTKLRWEDNTERHFEEIGH